MVDAGYNYERLGEKDGWLDIDPSSIRHILITHQIQTMVYWNRTWTLFRDATIYLSEEETAILTGEVTRKYLRTLLEDRYGVFF